MSDLRYALIEPFSFGEQTRKSRFLARAAPIATPAQAMDFLHASADPSASHNVWAYRIGQIYRFNDDGEPAGTAGRPILQAIDGQAIDDVIVVVTRWFGGIKLGAGGLVRAYGGAAAECLRRAPREPIMAMALVGLHCDFADLALLKVRLQELQAEVLSEDFAGDGVSLRMRLPEHHVANAQARVKDISRGRSTAKRLD